MFRRLAAWWQTRKLERFMVKYARYRMTAQCNCGWRLPVSLVSVDAYRAAAQHRCPSGSVITFQIQV